MSVCLACMKDIGASEKCPFCGFMEGNYSNPPHHLKLRTVLSDRYMIGKALGEGGFGITYLGWDKKLDIPVAIKEYFPNNSVTRNTTSYTLADEATVAVNEVTVYANSEIQKTYEDGIDKVIDEARRIAKFRGVDGIVGVQDVFKENGTAYIVMEYIDGVTIDKYCSDNDLNAQQILELVRPVFEALERLHLEGIIHRDISPDNIMVDMCGRAKLLDFGAARSYNSTTKSMSMIVKRGYAPEEQYREKGVQGPWTDVYALGATLYMLLSDITPTESLDRLVDDDLVTLSELNDAIPEKTSRAVETAMAIKANNRFGSISDFMNALYVDTSIEHSGLIVKKENYDKEEKVNKNVDKKRLYYRYACYGVVVVALFLLLLWGNKNKNIIRENNNIEASDDNVEGIINGNMQKSDGLVTSSLFDESNSTEDVETHEILVTDKMAFEPHKVSGFHIEEVNLKDYGMNASQGSYVGMEYDSIPEHIMDKSSVTNGVIVSKVDSNSPASIGGLLSNDIIIQVGDYNISNIKDMSNIDYKVGDIYSFTVYRLEDNEYIQRVINVEIGERLNYVMHLKYIGENGNYALILEEDKAWVRNYDDIIDKMCELTKYCNVLYCCENKKPAEIELDGIAGMVYPKIVQNRVLGSGIAICANKEYENTYISGIGSRLEDVSTKSVTGGMLVDNSYEENIISVLDNCIKLYEDENFYKEAVKSTSTSSEQSSNRENDDTEEVVDAEGKAVKKVLDDSDIVIAYPKTYSQFEGIYDIEDASVAFSGKWTVKIYLKMRLKDIESDSNYGTYAPMVPVILYGKDGTIIDSSTLLSMQTNYTKKDIGKVFTYQAEISNFDVENIKDEISSIEIADPQ